MKYRIHYVYAAILVFVLGACGTYIKVQQLAPPFPPTTACEVFTTSKPDRSYTELAIIEVYQGGNTITLARKKAMAMGADAIILTGRANYGAVTVAPGVVGAAEKMIFVAVKYK